MKKVSCLALCLVAVAVVVMQLGEAPVATAANCSPSELSSCLGAIQSGKAPSGECCGKLKEQQPCFCGYLKNPSLKPYVGNPNTVKVAKSCGVAYPKC